MKTKVHQKYFLSDGKTRVQGATTIITQQIGWNKGSLIGWTRKLALSGTDPSKERDDKADIGTLAHHFIITSFNPEAEIDTSDYSENQKKQALNCLDSFMEWSKGKIIEPILLEKPLVSEKYLYGGTPDI